jgi:hypothetical protein
MVPMVPCPRCGVGLANAASCPACHLPLTGPVAAQLWAVDQSIHEIDAQLAGLGARRTTLWQTHVTLLNELGHTVPMALPAFGGPARTARPTSPPPPPITSPRREWTPRRVQNLLLTIGALLLVIATAIFTAVSWHRLGDGPQALILTGVAAGTAVLTRFLSRRALTATAEAICAICIGLLVFDADAAHKVVLPGLTTRPYWAVATAALALVFAGLGRFTRARIAAIAAATSALLPLLVLAFGSNQPTADRALLLALDALLAAVALAGLRRVGAEGRTVSDVRICWIAGGSAAWLGGFTVPVSHLLYGLGGASMSVVLGGLAASGCAAAVTAWTVGEAQLPYRVQARAPLAGASALTLICALALPVQAHVDIVWWAATVIAAGLLILTAATQLPESWRAGPQWTALATSAVALSTELLSVSSTVAGQVGWYGRPWQTVTATIDGAAANAVAVPQQFGGAGNLVALLVAAVTAIVAAWLLGRRTIGIVSAAVLVALTTVVAVAQLSGSYGTGLALDAAATVVAAIAAALLQRRTLTALARTATVIALCSGAVALGWALALPAATAVVGCWLVTVLFATAAVAVPWREAWLAAATLAGGFAAVGVAHQLGAVDGSFGVVVAGVALSVAVALRWFSPSRSANVLDVCCGAMVFVALPLGGSSTGWTSWTLLVAATWSGAVCLRADRRVGAPVATVAGMIALVVLPPAQHLSVVGVLAAWCSLAAVAVGGSVASVLLGGEPSAERRQSAGALAIGSVPVVLLTSGLALVEGTGVTACLGVLCAVFAAAATLPTTLLTDRGLSLGWRAAATGLATALLLGASASAAHDAGLSTGRCGIVVAIVAGTIALAAGRLGSRGQDAVVAELTSAAGTGLALLAARPDALSVGWILAIAGLTVLLTASVPARRQLWPAGVLLLAAASWVWLRHAGVGAPEPYTDPVAGVALAAGYLRRRTVPTTASFTAYGAGLAALLIPSLLWALVDSGVERPLLLAALATAIVILGAQQGLRAPLILGSVTLVATALRLMAPYETLIPRWVEVGTAGTLLLVLGATYEQRRRDMAMLRSRYDALL